MNCSCFSHSYQLDDRDNDPNAQHGHDDAIPQPRYWPIEDELYQSRERVESDAICERYPPDRPKAFSAGVWFHKGTQHQEQHDDPKECEVDRFADSGNLALIN